MKKSRMKTFFRATVYASLIAICGAATAQSPDTVTIKYDDGDGITGELIEATETNVRLNTIMGAVTIPFEGVTCIGNACPEAIRYVAEDAPVVLTATEGSTQVSGNLIGIEAGQYVMATEVGELRIDVDMATCEGAACPAAAGNDDQDQPDPKVVLVHGTTTIEGSLIGLEEDAYIIEVELIGQVRVDREAECTGVACPTG